MDAMGFADIIQVGILGCGMKGVPLVLMSPLSFIARPTRWLEFMARHRTSHTVGPDFAFGLLARFLHTSIQPCSWASDISDACSPYTA